MGMLFKIILGFSMSVLLLSCGNNTDVVMQTPNLEEICVIADNDNVISDIQSMDIIDENRLVLSDMQSVFIYDIKAGQIQKIGHSGRAHGEYILPLIVRYNNDHIYIWSAGSLSFLLYDLDGNYINSYPYTSAISDFLADGQNIYVYTAGKSDDYIIDVVELPKNEVVNRLISANDEHIFMNRFVSAAAITIQGGKFYFLPKDKLQIYEYNPENGKCDKFTSVDSDTFIVQKGIQNTDKSNMRQVLGDNSLTISLLSVNNNLYLMTLEGELGESKSYIESEKYFAIYDCSKPKEVAIAKYPYSAIGTTSLIDTFNGSFYILTNSIIGEEDCYVLKKLK